MQSAVQLIGNTPLVRIRNLCPNKNVEIWAKVEGQNLCGSIKDRIALNIVEHAEATGHLTKDKTILEPTSGNTGIALAMIGALKGYKCLIVMSDAVSIERRKMIEAYGAKIILTPGKEGTDGAIMRARQMVKEDPDTYFMPDQFANNYNTLAHYTTTGLEIWRDLGHQPIDYVVCSIGTSGTIMGLSKFFKERCPNVKIVCAHPVKGHYIQGLKNMHEAINPSIYDPSKIDITVDVDSAPAFRLANEIVRKEGIFVGMSSGAALFCCS